MTSREGRISILQHQTFPVCTTEIHLSLPLYFLPLLSFPEPAVRGEGPARNKSWPVNKAKEPPLRPADMFFKKWDRRVTFCAEGVFVPRGLYLGWWTAGHTFFFIPTGLRQSPWCVCERRVSHGSIFLWPKALPHPLGPSNSPPKEARLFEKPKLKLLKMTKVNQWQRVSALFQS